jgi:hypothetical protein
MLQVTADIFSGRENPTWLIQDEAEARTTLAELARSQHLLTEAPPADAGLGFRGFVIEPLADDLALDFQVGPSVYLAAGPQARDSRATELAERLIALTERGQQVAQDAVPLGVPLRELLRTQLHTESRVSMADEGPAAAQPVVEAVAAAVTCMIELAAYNPGFWNNDPNVRSHNNCYHYASNKRRDTFRTAVAGGGQPGAGCGRQYTAITCPEVTRAALCDGLHHRFNCFPDSEKPRYLVALVVAPSWPDFHWYRKNKEGFWSHKPGQTAVRNVDNSNRLITDPQTCDRGPYTQFCGYFYTCRSQRIR